VWIDSVRHESIFFNFKGYLAMTKEELLEKIKGILKTDSDFSFLLQLKQPDVETLIACIRDRVDNQIN
jgi:hypothetical protein